MDFSNFKCHGNSHNREFEIMCNLLFERWCRREYENQFKYFTTVNGAGGDGGVEAYLELIDGAIIGVQAKWFRENFGDVQIRQIKNSFETAYKTRPRLKKYIVCIPRDLTSKRAGTNLSQESKWLNLLEELKDIAPTVDVKLWDETRIISELQYPESLGSRLYWFENEEIDTQKFIIAFDKACGSLACQSYVGDLYTPGFINNQITKFIRNEKINRTARANLNSLMLNLEGMKFALLDLRSIINDKEKIGGLVLLIDKDLQDINHYLDNLILIKKIVEDGYAVDNVLKLDLPEFACNESVIKEYNLYSDKYFNVSHVLNCINKVKTSFKNFRNTLYVNNDNKLVFVGNAGTGKTFGIVSEIKNIFKGNIHIPILVHAKEYCNNTWLEIISKSLGLGGNWDEDKLFQALEMTAYIKECDHRKINNIKVVSRVVICIDGLDEARSYAFWKNKIRETDAYKDRYPRLRFVFLSRPAVFDNENKDEIRKIVRYIPIAGDINTNLLFDKYIEYYCIDTSNCLWVKDYLKTPLAVKLFCEVYKNTEVKIEDSRGLVLTELFKKKIEKLDDRFNTENGINEKVIQISLVRLSKLFLGDNQPEKNKVVDYLKDIGYEKTYKVLDFLENCGLIYGCYKQSDNILEEPKKYYIWGQQTVFDYLLARQLLGLLQNANSIQENYGPDVLRLLSLLVIEETGHLISEYENLMPEVYKHWLFDLDSYSIVNASTEIASNYSERVRKVLTRNPHCFRLVVNKVIIPATKIPEHPLGANLLDEFLSDFSKPAMRDIWWSIPSNLWKGFREDWYSNESIDFKSIEITENMKWSALPLIAFWGLSNVNNDTRHYLRIELTRWAVNNQQDFIHLFKKALLVNDSQIQEDIFAIAYGIALYRNVEEKYLKDISELLINNVLTEKWFTNYCDVALRYYTQGILTIAKNRKAIRKWKLPHKVFPFLMPICFEATSGKANVGYDCIDYDLSRYVLCEPIKNRFFYGNFKRQCLTDGARKLFKNYELASFNCDGMILGLAYQYILDCGWNNKIFDMVDEHIGVDVAIRNAFRGETHGNKSKTMTIAEKYIWVGRYRIEAFLADNLKFYDNDRYVKLKDYLKVDNFLCPLFELNCQIDNNCENVEPVVNELSSKEPDIKSIKEWMVKSSLPNFDKYLNCSENQLLLYDFSQKTDSKHYIKELIIISSGFVKHNDLAVVIDNIDKYSSDVINPEEFHSYQNVDCYISPVEVCSLTSRKEFENELIINSGGKYAIINKTLTECSAFNGQDKGINYKVPSKFIREITGIVYGDGYSYFNQEGKEIAVYNNSEIESENYRQYLCYDQRTILDALNKRDYVLVWFIRISRRLSYKSRELFDDFYNEADHTFLVWYNKGKCEYKQIKDVESSTSWNLPFEGCCNTM